MGGERGRPPGGGGRQAFQANVRQKSLFRIDLSQKQRKEKAKIQEEREEEDEVKKQLEEELSSLQSSRHHHFPPVPSTRRAMHK